MIQRNSARIGIKYSCCVMENRGLTVARKFELRGKEGRKEGARIEDTGFASIFALLFSAVKIAKGNKYNVSF